jgi:hypothetical protein
MPTSTDLRSHPSSSLSAGLSLGELALLREIHEADRDHGGLSSAELSPEEALLCGELADRGFAEALSEFGEAPDGEEDERDAGGCGHCFRITERGVLALRDA